MPDDWPDYPHHSQLLQLSGAVRRALRAAATASGSAPRSSRSTPVGDGRWDVTTRSTGGGAERVQRYAAVVVANGHNWSPKPLAVDGLDVPGAGHPRVGVQGSGAVARPQGARDRRRQHRLRHRRRGRPAGHARSGTRPAAATGTRPSTSSAAPPTRSTTRCCSWRLPLRLRQWLYHRTVELTVGDVTRYGLPEPDHRPYESHPVVNSQLVYYLGHGRITPVPDVARFDGAGRGADRRPPDRARPGDHRDRLPAALRVPRARAAGHATPTAGPTCTCTRSPGGTRRSPWSGCCRPTPGCSRWRTGRASRWPAGCGCAPPTRSGPRRCSSGSRPGRCGRGRGCGWCRLVAALVRGQPHRLPARPRRPAASSWSPRHESQICCGSRTGRRRSRRCEREVLSAVPAEPTTTGRRCCSCRGWATGRGRSPSTGWRTPPSRGFPAHALSARGRTAVAAGVRA